MLGKLVSIWNYAHRDNGPTPGKLLAAIELIMEELDHASASKHMEGVAVAVSPTPKLSEIQIVFKDTKRFKITVEELER